MPARKPDMYECVDGFVTAEGVHVAVGDLVRAGHPIMKNRDWAFKPFSGPRFEIEQATSAPGEKRGAAS
jgi:hypothetical protein